MTASNSELFDPLTVSGIRRRPFSTETAAQRSLFDFAMEPVRRRRPEASVRPEEDLERWDGLS